MIIKGWKKNLFTIPNFLSFFRLLLIPVYITIYLHASRPRDHVMAASILAISCLTDALDGILARKLHMISKFGKFLDPLADKATQCALTICLAIRYPVLWFLMAIFVVKESFQLLAGIIELHKGRMLIGALPSGKICTSFLFLSFILLVLFPHISSTIVILLTMIDSIFLLISFANYAIVYHLKYNHFENIEKYHDNSI